MKDSRKHRTWLVDIDGTLCTNKCYTPEECLKAEPIWNMVDKINVLAVADNIIIYTARRDALIPATLQWLRKNGISFHAISNNKIPAIGKYVDDHAMSIEDFLNVKTE